MRVMDGVGIQVDAVRASAAPSGSEGGGRMASAFFLIRVGMVSPTTSDERRGYW